MGEHKEKERSCKKKSTGNYYIGLFHATLNFCVHVTAGKHFTTQGISLQMKAKIKSLHT